jgi:hypothetical protein
MINTIKNLYKKKASSNFIHPEGSSIHPNTIYRRRRAIGKPLYIHTEEKLHSRNGHILDLN